MRFSNDQSFRVFFSVEFRGETQGFVAAFKKSYQDAIPSTASTHIERFNARGIAFGSELLHEFLGIVGVFQGRDEQSKVFGGAPRWS